MRPVHQGAPVPVVRAGQLILRARRWADWAGFSRTARSSVDERRGKLKIRRVIDGSRLEVLHLPADDGFTTAGRKCESPRNRDSSSGKEPSAAHFAARSSTITNALKSIAPSHKARRLHLS
jgi:hypothetical protein